MNFLPNWLSESPSSAGFRRWPRYVAFIAAMVLPAFLVVAVSYFQMREHLTALTLSQRKAVARLAASTTEERLDRLVDLGSSAATGITFSQLVQEGRWDEAIRLLGRILSFTNAIDRYFLADLEGTLKTDSPPLPGVRGHNFKDRDWYRGVSRRWEPYVSEVDRRSGPSQAEVVTLSFPIRARDDSIVGILGLEITLNWIHEWAGGMDVGNEGFVYLADKNGRIIVHPKTPPPGGLAAYASAPEIRNAAQGQLSVGVMYNSTGEKKRVSAYAPVPKYGWVVMVTQPVDEAFAQRKAALTSLAIFYGVCLFLAGMLAVAVVRAMVLRRRAAEGTSQAWNFLNSIVENIPNMIFVKDAKELRFVKFNKAGEELIGFPREQMIGKNDYDFFPREEADFFTGKDREVLASKDCVDIKEEPIHTRMKGTRFLHTRKIPILDERGNPLFLLGISEDVTEAKQRDREIIELNHNLAERASQLEAANKELEAFSYSISHDLRAPLRSIDGFCHALVEDCWDKLDEAGRDSLQRVRGASQRMGRLIDELLSLSSMARKRMLHEKVDLSALARACAEDLRRSHPSRVVDLAIAEGLQARGDSDLLRVVLENLLDNAWKFTGKRPRARIEFGTLSRDGEVVYFVRDNGAGFDMAYADKLFGAFQRLHRADEFSGTGVGLASVQRIIHRHGGRVWAEGIVESGATVYFTLGSSSTQQGTRADSAESGAADRAVAAETNRPPLAA